MHKISLHPASTKPGQIERIQRETGHVAVIGRRAVHLVPAHQYLDAIGIHASDRTAMLRRLGLPVPAEAGAA